MTRSLKKFSTRNYQMQYNELSEQFWALKNTEITEEEKKYTELMNDLYELRLKISNDFNDMENENLELSKMLEGFEEVYDEYNKCQRILENLEKLNESIEENS